MTGRAEEPLTVGRGPEKGDPLPLELEPVESQEARVRASRAGRVARSSRSNIWMFILRDPWVGSIGGIGQNIKFLPEIIMLAQARRACSMNLTCVYEKGSNLRYLAGGFGGCRCVCGAAYDAA